MLDHELSATRLRSITLALAGGFVLSVLLYLVAGERAGSSLFRGDFPAFYAAAEIVWTGRGMELYDYGFQRALENRHWPDFEGEFLAYPYPPFFALILSPLAALAPLAAKGLASFTLFCSLLGALLLARRSCDFVSEHFSFTFFYLLTFPPLMLSIVGVQNTGLSILCFGLFHWATQTRRPLLAGLAASLLLFKPQFGILFLIYLIWRGNHRELIGWGSGAFAMYLLGTLVLGFSWPLAWLKAASHFGDLNFTINAHNMISLAGLTYWFAEQFGLDGARGLPLAYLLSALLLVMTAWYVGRDAKRMLLVPSLVLFLSPQTLFYDAGLAVCYLLCTLRPRRRVDILLLGAIWLYGASALLLRDTTSFPLMSVLLLSIMLIQFQRVGHSVPAGHRP